MGCDFESDAMLQLRVREDRKDALWGGNPPPYSTAYSNSLADHDGLQGIRIAVSGIGQDMTFTVADFGEPARNGERLTKPVSVPSDGWIYVDAELSHDGDVVAEGVHRWLLEAKVEWSLTIDRGPYGAVRITTDGRDPEG